MGQWNSGQIRYLSRINMVGVGPRWTSVVVTTSWSGSGGVSWTQSPRWTSVSVTISWSGPRGKFSQYQLERST